MMEDYTVLIAGIIWVRRFCRVLKRLEKVSNLLFLVVVRAMQSTKFDRLFPVLQNVIARF